jgi:hypothetical protein
MKKANKLATGLLMGALALAPIKEGLSQIKGNVEKIFSQKKENSYVRLNAFYGLPLGINGYTFIEHYKDGKGYFGKSMLAKPITKNLAGKMEMIHINDPLSQAGFGLEATLPTPKGTTAKVKFLPVYLDDKGKYVKDKKVLGYFIFADLGKGFEFSGFGEYNADAKQWGYGEFELNKSLGKGIKIGYNPALMPEGKPLPKVEHRAKVQINF